MSEINSGINSGAGNEQELRNLLEESKKIGEKFIKGSILTELDVNRILDYQQTLINSDKDNLEIPSFLEILFGSKNIEKNRKKFLDFISSNGIILTDREKIKIVESRTEPIISKQEETKVKVCETINTPKKKRIGDGLIEAHLITQRNLDDALKFQAEKKAEGKMIMIGEILMLKGIIDRRKFLNFIESNKDFSIEIGELLVANNLIDLDQLEKARNIQEKLKKENIEKQIGDILVEDMDVVSKERLLRIIGQQRNMSRIEPTTSQVDTRILYLFDKEYLKENNFIPYKVFLEYGEKEESKDKILGYTITVLIDEPDVKKLDKKREYIISKSSKIKEKLAPSIDGKKDIDTSIKINIVFEYTPKDEIDEFIDKCFRDKTSLESAQKSAFIGKEHLEEGIFKVGKGFHSKTNANLNIFADILMRSLEAGASDIHIEPDIDKVRIRARIDGALQNIMELPANVKGGFSRALKNSFGFKDSWKPGEVIDSRKSAEYVDKDIKADLRFSVVPSIFGDNIVCRVLVQPEKIPTIQELGMQPNIAREYELIGKMSSGIVLVTGPTGSGKTTTLLSTLTSLNTIEKKIITIEDPPEYIVKGIVQIDRNKYDLAFGEILRGLLRQDPDIIMVGEMRDSESASHALEAGQTGRLLFTTLHTADAISAITRLYEMGIKPYLLGSTLVSIIGQRLVRRVCPNCKIPYTPDGEDLHYFRNYLQDMDEFLKENDVTFYKGKGCKHCNQTGYKGRIGIVELFCVNKELKLAVLAGKTSTELTTIARGYGMTSMVEDGFCRALNGETTLEEVLRLARTNEFPELKRKVKDIQYLLHGPMTNREIENIVYGSNFVPKSDIDEQMVKILEKDSDILEKSVNVEKEICGGIDHLTGLIEGQNRLIAHQNLVMEKFTNALTNQKD